MVPRSTNRPRAANIPAIAPGQDVSVPTNVPHPRRIGRVAQGPPHMPTEPTVVRFPALAVPDGPGASLSRAPARSMIMSVAVFSCGLLALLQLHGIGLIPKQRWEAIAARWISPPDYLEDLPLITLEPLWLPNGAAAPDRLAGPASEPTPASRATTEPEPDASQPVPAQRIAAFAERTAVAASPKPVTAPSDGPVFPSVLIGTPATASQEDSRDDRNTSRIR